MATKWKNVTGDSQVIPSLQSEDGGTVIVEPGATFETSSDLSNLAAFEKVPSKPDKTTAKAKTSEEK